MSKKSLEQINPIQGVGVDAIYTKSKDPMYSHNRLAEALPPKLTKKRFEDEARWHPAIKENERSGSKEYRGTAIERINALVEPLPTYSRFYDRLYGQLLSGYLNRNPSSREHQQQLHSAFPSKHFEDQVYGNRRRNIPQASRGSCVLGISGTGKSTMVDTTTDLFPQLITHSANEDLSIGPFQQVVWIKLQCAYGKTIKDVIFSFFLTVDTLLNTDYVNKFSSGSWSEPKLIIQMALIARKINLGVLIVEEIQHLRYRQDTNTLSHQGIQKASYPPTLLKMLVTFSNTMGIPIIFVGTPDAESLLGKTMPLARRSTESGVITMPRFKPGKQWDNFLEVLFRYQFLKKPVSLDETLNSNLYRASQGIVNYAIRIFMLAQWETIYSGTEELKPSIIPKVAKLYLGPVLPWLDLIAKPGHSRKLMMPEMACTQLSWAHFFEIRQEGGFPEIDAPKEDESTLQPQPPKRRTKKQEDQIKAKTADENYETLKDKGIIPSKD